MLTIEKVDTDDKSQVKRFVQFYYDLYKDCPEWVPPLFVDAYLPLNRKKHPFFERSEADFFLAVDNGKVVGRICAANNKPFNEYHHTHKAHFYGFDTIDDQQVANLLFNAVFDWSHARGLDTVIGPKGLSPFDGYGIQVEGFQYRQMMTMMNYNFAYYPKLMEALEFEKEVDFVSCYLPADSFHVPERVERIAKRAMERGHLTVKQFKSKKELLQWAPRIGEAYNRAFINNWEYYPFSPSDVKYAVDNVFLVLTARQLNPKLFIMARAIYKESKSKLLAAGASAVESPYEVGAVSMAHRIIRPTVTSFLDLALTYDRKDIQMEEIPISPLSTLSNVMLKNSRIRQEYNLIIIAIKQVDGSMMFNPSFETRLEPGATVIAVGQERDLQKLEKILCPV